MRGAEYSAFATSCWSREPPAACISPWSNVRQSAILTSSSIVGTRDTIWYRGKNIDVQGSGHRATTKTLTGIVIRPCGWSKAMINYKNWHKTVRYVQEVL